MATNYSLYKLIILFMLQNAEGPVTASHISEFILGQEYTDYFTLQQSIGELQASNLVHTETTSNATLFTITQAGINTLTYLGERISETIQTEVIEYLKEHEMMIRSDVAAIASYHTLSSGAYSVNCRLQENEISSLIDLTIKCESKEQAEAICRNWKEQNFELYSYLMDLLVK